MRAIAASMVAIYHFSYHYEWNTTTTNILHFGAQGVELFFIISGFIIPYALHQSNFDIKNTHRHLLKRVLRLYPPFVFTCILIILSEMMFHNYIYGSAYEISIQQLVINWFLLADFIQNIEWINPIYATLAVELQFYLLISLIFGLLMRNKWYMLLVISVLLLLSTFTNQQYSILSQTPYFLIGFCAFKLKKIEISTSTIIALILVLATIAFSKTFEDSIVSLLGLAIISFIPENTKLLNRTGKISYSFYLIHGLIGVNLINFYSHTNLSIDYPIFFIMICFGASWIFALLIFQLIEKPYIRISKLIKY